jgi:hypothetical protein
MSNPIAYIVIGGGEAGVPKPSYLPASGLAQVHSSVAGLKQSWYGQRALTLLPGSYLKQGFGP